MIEYIRNIDDIKFGATAIEYMAHRNSFREKLPNELIEHVIKELSLINEPIKICCSYKYDIIRYLFITDSTSLRSKLIDIQLTHETNGTLKSLDESHPIKYKKYNKGELLFEDINVVDCKEFQG